jgi:hypothetical protein
MPDAAERAGDFSQSTSAGKLVTIYDPSTGAPFPGNIIPPSRISPQALSLLQYYPEPNFPGNGTYNFQVPLIANTHTDNLRIFAQQTVARRNNFSGLLALQDTRGDTNSQFNFLDLNRSLGINGQAAWRRTFTPRFFGTLTYQFTRQSTRLVPYFADRVNVSGEAGITGNNQDPINWGPPALQFNQSSITGLSDGTPSIVHNQTGAVSYLSIWNHHEHNIQFGADYRRQQFNTLSQSNPRGLFTFTGARTGSGASTGFDFADFLLGRPDAGAIAFGNADKYLRAIQPDAFSQDDWRIAPGVTLLLGLRWEYTSPITEKYGRLVNLDIAPGFTDVVPVVARDQKSPLIRPYYHEFEPRIGLAWRPFPTSSMVIRAGYGISYNTQIYLRFANQMVQQSPLSTSLNVASTPANPLTLANGFYAPSNVTTNTIAVDPDFKPGYAQVWNLMVQRDLPDGLQMVATYTGTKGTHQLQAFAPNTYPDGPVAPSGYIYYTSYGNSTREAGILQLRRRLHSGFAAQAQYTYSKSLDDAAVLRRTGSISPPSADPPHSTSATWLISPSNTLPAWVCEAVRFSEDGADAWPKTGRFSIPLTWAAACPDSYICAALPRHGNSLQCPGGLYGRFALRRASPLLPELRGCHRARGGPVGKCREEFDHRAGTGFHERIDGVGISGLRSRDFECKARCEQSAEPCRRHAIERGRDQSPLRTARRRERHAYGDHDSEDHVLKRRRAAWLLLPLAALAQQMAQQKDQVQSQVQPATTNATFTSNTQLIVEEVTVKDKKGKVIEGLTKEDFILTEDGKPRPFGSLILKTQAGISKTLTRLRNRPRRYPNPRS